MNDEKWIKARESMIKAEAARDKGLPRFSTSPDEEIRDKEEWDATNSLAGFFRWLAKHKGSIRLHDDPEGTRINVVVYKGDEQYGYQFYMEETDSEFWHRQLQPAVIELYREITNV
jgi:hypothetical protein